MSENINQIFVANPITTIGDTDLIYVGEAGTTDAAISGLNLKAQFAGSVTPADVQNNTYTFAADSNFTADVYVVSPSPAWSAYQASQTLYMFSNTPNLTDSPTLNVSGLGAINIKLLGGDPVSPGDIGYGISVFQLSNGANQAILLNPANTYRLIPGLNQGIVFTAADSGAVNAYAGAYQLPGFSNIGPSQGSFIYLLVANTNTGASTFNLNGSGAFPIVTAGGVALTAGQMVAGYFAHLIYTGSAQYQLLNPAV